MHYKPAILLLGVYSKKPKTLIEKDISTLMFIAALFTTAKYGSNPSAHINRQWIKKSCHIKKNKITSFATTWMDLEGIILSEMSDRERQIPYYFIYMWNLNNKINKQN